MYTRVVPLPVGRPVNWQFNKCQKNFSVACTVRRALNGFVFQCHWCSVLLSVICVVTCELNSSRGRLSACSGFFRQRVLSRSVTPGCVCVVAGAAFDAAWEADSDPVSNHTWRWPPWREPGLPHRYLQPPCHTLRCKYLAKHAFFCRILTCST